MNELLNSIKIENKLFEILINQNDIQKKITNLAESISKDYKNKEIVLICVLNGAFLFFGDLTKKLELRNIIIDFIQLSSYKGKTENSGIKLIKDINTDITGKDVVIIEDIIDTGNSLKFLNLHLLSKNPNSLKICTLINKVERRDYESQIDYVGFNLESGFIVGYGMDYMEKGRNLKDIYVLKD